MTVDQRWFAYVDVDASGNVCPRVVTGMTGVHCLQMSRTTDYCMYVHAMHQQEAHACYLVQHSGPITLTTIQ